MIQTIENTVELHFPIAGTELPSDHGYLLYSAISYLLPDVHKDDSIGIHTVKGSRVRPGVIRIAEEQSLRVRLPLEKVPYLYKLAGSRLKVGEFNLRCGIPTLRLLRPSRRLYSRLVIIKTAQATNRPEDFLAAVERKLKALNTKVNPQLERQKDGSNAAFMRRIVTVKKTTIVGYGVVLEDLSDEDSQLIQVAGLGGRRRMGCGIFDPVDSEGT